MPSPLRPPERGRPVTTCRRPAPTGRRAGLPEHPAEPLRGRPVGYSIVMPSSRTCVDLVSSCDAMTSSHTSARFVTGNHLNVEDLDVPLRVRLSRRSYRFGGGCGSRPDAPWAGGGRRFPHETSKQSTGGRCLVAAAGIRDRPGIGVGQASAGRGRTAGGTAHCAGSPARRARSESASAGLNLSHAARASVHVCRARCGSPSASCTSPRSISAIASWYPSPISR